MYTIIHLNYVAIAIATLAYLGLGSLWYSKAMFGNAWVTADGAALQVRGARMLVTRLVVSFIISFSMALLVVLTGSTSVTSGLVLSAITAIGFIATASLVNNQLGNRPIKLWLINSGYHLVGCILVGFTVTIWRAV